MVAEAIMYMEREEIAGPDYRPYRSEVYKWASQRGSVFIGDRKVKLDHPRLRGPQGEMGLRTYGKLKERGKFSGELLGRVLRGVSRSEVSGDAGGSGWSLWGIAQFGIAPPH